MRVDYFCLKTKEMKRQSNIRFLNESAEEATIDIYGEIGYEGWDRSEDENTARQLSEELDRIKAIKAKRITVRINSLGGDVNHALAIHDLLAEHPASITTQINGLCASAATIVAMAGSERKMSKNALFLIHQCSAWIGRANQETLSQELETQKTVNHRLLSIYNEKCPDREREIEELLKANNGRGKWLTAAEAQELGFVTDVYNETRKTACVSANAISENGLPELPSAYTDLLTDEDYDGPMQSFLNTISRYISRNQKPINQSPMKKTLPLIAALLAFADEASYDKDKGMQLDDSQLQKIENALSAYEKLKTEHQQAMNAKSLAEASLTSVTADRDRLKALVDAIPSQTPAVNGKDPDKAPKDDIKTYVSQSPLYQSIKQEL